MASNNKKKSFLEGNHAAISTTGHVLNYLQNRQTQKNQQTLAEMEMVNASLMDEQNRLRQQELTKLEELKAQQERQKAEAEKKEELKTKVLELAPKTKAMGEHLQTINEDGTFITSLLIRHAEINLAFMEEHKKAVNDISFFDYLYQINAVLKEAKAKLPNYQQNLEDFGQQLAELLVEYNAVLNGLGLMQKEPLQFFKEEGEQAVKYLENFLNKTEAVIADNSGFEKLKSLLEYFVKAGQELGQFDQPFSHDQYPLPITFEEASYSIATIEDILENEQEYLQEVKEFVGKISDLLDDDNSKKLLNTLATPDEKLTLDQIELIREKINDPLIEYAKEELYHRVTELQVKLSKMAHWWNVKGKELLRGKITLQQELKEKEGKRNNHRENSEIKYKAYDILDLASLIESNFEELKKTFKEEPVYEKPEGMALLGGVLLFFAFVFFITSANIGQEGFIVLGVLLLITGIIFLNIKSNSISEMKTIVDEGLLNEKFQKIKSKIEERKYEIEATHRLLKELNPEGYSPENILSKNETSDDVEKRVGENTDSNLEEVPEEYKKLYNVVSDSIKKIQSNPGRDLIINIIHRREVLFQIVNSYQVADTTKDGREHGISILITLTMSTKMHERFKKMEVFKEFSLEHQVVGISSYYKDFNNDSFGLVKMCKYLIEELFNRDITENDPIHIKDLSSNPYCFIVTAATGSSNNYVVNDFRAYRDDRLLNTFLGRVFIFTYYKVGPYAAKFIAKRPVVKKAVLNKLILPAHRRIMK